MEPYIGQKSLCNIEPLNAVQSFLCCRFINCRVDSLVCQAHIYSLQDMWNEKHTASTYAKCIVNSDSIAVLHILMYLFSLTFLWFWPGLVLHGLRRKATKGYTIAHVIVQHHYVVKSIVKNYMKCGFSLVHVFCFVFLSPPCLKAFTNHNVVNLYKLRF